MRSPKIIGIIVGGLILSSCGNNHNRKEAELGQGHSTQEKLSSEFSTVKESVFLARCVSCHQQYNSYQGVVRELWAIQTAVASNKMPKSGGPLNDTQKEILSAWIAEGAPDKAGQPNDPGLIGPVEPTWKSISENVIFPKCLVCHNPLGQAKFLDLSSRQIIFDNRNRTFGDGAKLIDFDHVDSSYLVQILTDPEEPMPPGWSNIPRLKQDELKIIKLWLSRGLP